jgi:hypothetical protein
VLGYLGSLLKASFRVEALKAGSISTSNPLGSPTCIGEIVYGEVEEILLNLLKMFPIP